MPPLQFSTCTRWTSHTEISSPITTATTFTASPGKWSSSTLMQRRYSRSTCWVCSTSILRFRFFKHEKDSRRVWKASKSKKMTQTWTFIEEFWDVFLLVAKDRAETSPATPAYAPTGTDLFGVFNESPQIDPFPWEHTRVNGRNGTWQTSISSLLGKHSKRLFVRKVGHWRNHSKKISGASKRSFCVPSRTCSRLGFGFLADHGCGTVPVPKETTQITSSSHNTNLTNHIHLTHQAFAILHWWDDTAHHCCSVNLLGLGMTHIACLPPDPTVHVAWL